MKFFLIPIELDLCIFQKKEKKKEEEEEEQYKRNFHSKTKMKRSGRNKMMGRGHGGESKINVASSTFVPGHRTPQLLWLSGFADTRKLQT